jgi:hypothetical protein
VLTVLPADKGNAAVILNTEDYTRKIATLLEDPAYRRLAKDPTEANEDLCPDQEVFTAGRSRRAAASTRFKATQAIWAPENTQRRSPLRPTASTIGAPTYSLAKHLVGLLGSQLINRNIM